MCNQAFWYKSQIKYLYYCCDWAEEQIEIIRSWNLDPIVEIYELDVYFEDFECY